MSALSFVRYSSSSAESWNAFNREAVNGHFLFDRAFMDYHSDRFMDASIMLLRGGRVAGIFPANLAKDQLHSHQGLTFGGLVHEDTGRVTEILEMFESVREHSMSLGAHAVIYKAMPSIYYRSPADSGLYGLFRNHAVCQRREVTTTIDYRCGAEFSRRRKRAIRKGLAAGLELRWDDGWEEFWAVLAEVLGRRHNRVPVHSAAELRLLANRFPNNIKLFVAKKNCVTVAGVVMFESAYVAHAQYIAAGADGQELCALDASFDYLIAHYSASKRYFDFGVSTEDGGWYLNSGLADYKQEWGGGSVVHDTYSWTI